MKNVMIEGYIVQYDLISGNIELPKAITESDRSMIQNHQDFKDLQKLIILCRSHENGEDIDREEYLRLLIYFFKRSW